jgi:hypothetical protein
MRQFLNLRRMMQKMTLALVPVRMQLWKLDSSALMTSMRRFFHEESDPAPKTVPMEKTLAILCHCRSSHALFPVVQISAPLRGIVGIQALSGKPRDLEQSLGGIVPIRKVLQESIESEDHVQYLFLEYVRLGILHTACRHPCDRPE